MLSHLRGHHGFISSVTFSPDGSKIISVSLDQSIRVWDAGTGAELSRSYTMIAVDTVSSSALRGPIVSSDKEWFTDINTGRCLGRLPVGAGIYGCQIHGLICAGWTTEDKLVLIHFPAM
jgi:WD40 repeat protein